MAAAGVPFLYESAQTLELTSKRCNKNLLNNPVLIKMELEV